MIDDEARQTAGVHLLSIVTLDLQGFQADETARRSTDSPLQRLWPQVHSAESEVEREQDAFEPSAADYMRPLIIEQALRLSGLVAGLIDKVRAFYYEVMLSEHRCPRCEVGLEMIREGRCRCRECGLELDPTVVFQRCSACGGELRLNVRRYSCRSCGADVPSRFVFDGLIFDAEYFRQKMAESRERKRELRERVRQMLAASRSESILAPQIEGLTSDLLLALDGLMTGPESCRMPDLSSRFDLNRYQSHVNAHIGPIATAFDEIPPLSENPRLDRIWRFITIIFLAHASTIDVWQDGQIIMVKKHEVDAERQGVPGDAEEADGVEGPVGRAEA